MTAYDEASDARKRLRIKSNVELWHKFVGFAGWLLLTAKGEEQSLYSKCVHYSYDDDAFEEYCNCPQIKRMKDFKADDECWKCKFFELKPIPRTRKTVKEVA
jgi:hypothetical protein